MTEPLSHKNYSGFMPRVVPIAMQFDKSSTTENRIVIITVGSSSTDLLKMTLTGWNIAAISTPSSTNTRLSNQFGMTLKCFKDVERTIPLMYSITGPYMDTYEGKWLNRGTYMGIREDLWIGTLTDGKMYVELEKGNLPDDFNFTAVVTGTIEKV